MKQNKSILFLTRLYHPHTGGVEKHVRNVTKLLTQKGHPVTIVTEQYNRKLKREELIDGVKVLRIPIGQEGYFKKFYIWKWILFHLNVFLNTDVIHIHDVFYWILPFRWLLFGKKIYITFHGYEGYPIKLSWILLRKLSEKLSKGSICVGDFMKKWYFASPSMVIYGAVRLVDKKYKEKAFSAVFFGRMDGQTGILEYIKAYNLIKKIHPEFKFTIVGDGIYAKNLPKGVKKVEFVEDVSKFIGENRFIFVSRYLSILEALIQKKDVVSVYNSPIMKDYLLMSPFSKYITIVSSGEEIAKVVLERLNKRSTSKNREEAYQWAKRQSWENLVHVYLKLWQ